jgi:AAA domain
MAAPKSSISFTISTSDDYDRQSDNEGVIATIYGQEGVGKTMSLVNLPTMSTWVLGFDTGVKVLKRMKTGHRLTQIRNDLANIDAIIEMINTDDERSELFKTKKEMFPDGIKFLVIDHVTEMFNFLTNAFADRRNHFIRSLKDAGDANAAMKRYLSIFRNFADSGINVVFLGLEQPYEVGMTAGEDPRAITKIMPFIGGKPALPTQLCGISDIVGRFVYDPVAGTRAIRLSGSVEGMISCKSRFTEGASDFPTGEWEEADVFRLLCKAHSIDPDKAHAKVQKDNAGERERLKGSKGQRVSAQVNMNETDLPNSVTGSMNEKKKKEERDEE